jgi:2-oxo-3-hexenedioate decarboxylase
MSSLVDRRAWTKPRARPPSCPVREEQRFSVEEAYEVQAASIARRLARGERRVGMKMGFTSRAKMQQMGVHDMIWGRLTDAMAEEDGATVALSAASCIHAWSPRSPSC